MTPDDTKPPDHADRVRPTNEQDGPNIALDLFAVTRKAAEQLFPRDLTGRAKWLEHMRSEIRGILTGPASDDPSSTAAAIGTYADEIDDLLCLGAYSSSLAAFAGDQRDPDLQNALEVRAGLASATNQPSGWRYTGSRNIYPIPFPTPGADAH